MARSMSHRCNCLSTFKLAPWRGSGLTYAVKPSTCQWWCVHEDLDTLWASTQAPAEAGSAAGSRPALPRCIMKVHRPKNAQH